MVNDFIEVSVHFKDIFDLSIPRETQREVANSSFTRLKEEYMETPEAQAKLLEMQQNPRKRGYFFPKRNFSKAFVANSFHRTQAPRFAALGSTFYGMKKILKKEILTELSKEFNATFIDFDFSAAHAKRAPRIQGQSELSLRECVQSPTFWNERVQDIFPQVEQTELNLKKKACRGVLKVMLSPSLNGGNPFSPARVLDNLSGADPFLAEKVALSDIPFEQWNLSKDFFKVFGKDELGKEGKELNLKCIDQWGTQVFPIDRSEPSKISSKH